MLSKFILAVVLAAAALGARAQSPAYGLPGTTTGSPVLWPAQSGSPVYGLPSAAQPTQISAWPMNEGSGLTLHDVSGNSNTATISVAGAVTWQSNSGIPGTTTLWSGTGKATATSTTLTNFDGTKPFSVAVWIKTTASVESTFLGTLNPSNNFQGWSLEIASGGAGVNPRLFLINSFSATNLIQVDTFSTGTTDGELHYIVATYDGSRTAAGVKIYKDGNSLITTVTTDSLSATTASGLPVTIGARADGSTAYVGAMAFSEIVPGVLSPSTISANFTAGPKIN